MTSTSHGTACSTAPMPETPTTMSARSLSAQIAATANTCSRRMPCRSTKRFCAPMAMMSEKPRPRPASRDESGTPSTVGQRARQSSSRFFRSIRITSDGDPARPRTHPRRRHRRGHVRCGGAAAAHHAVRGLAAREEPRAAARTRARRALQAGACDRGGRRRRAARAPARAARARRARRVRASMRHPTVRSRSRSP